LPNVFPAAAQPDVVRASQKAGIIVIPACRRYTEIFTDLQDELYLHYLIDACHDAVRRLLGPRRALLWNRHASAAFSAPSTHRETAVVGQILYYSLTTGAGVQTLGEEYCDILQVTGQSLVMRFSGVATNPDAIPGRQNWHFGGGTAHPFCFMGITQSDEQYVHQPSWTVSLDRLMKKIAGRWRSLWQVLSQYSGAAVRLHLALFYFYGLYYHWSKRATGKLLCPSNSCIAPEDKAQQDAEHVYVPYCNAYCIWGLLYRQCDVTFVGKASHHNTIQCYDERYAGVRYMFIGKLFEHRPSYHLLGVLLFIQLGITSASWAIRNLASLPGSASKSPEIEPSSSTTRQKERKAVVLEDDSTLAALSPVRLSEGGEVSAYRKCPLCLSMRQQPTATPCGHVFCWQCIAEWGNQKPECPLCRSPFTQSSLVCMHHADF
ncbi:MAG: peroxisome biogenesis factor 10-like, partial [Trebouxia sp. A1-2]